MVSSEEELSISSQCQLLDIPRSSLYYIPKPVSDEELTVTKLIDQCYLELPYYGTRRIKDWLSATAAYFSDRNTISKAKSESGQSKTQGLSVPAQRSRHQPA